MSQTNVFLAQSNITVLWKGILFYILEVPHSKQAHVSTIMTKGFLSFLQSSQADMTVCMIRPCIFVQHLFQVIKHHNFQFYIAWATESIVK